MPFRNFFNSSFFVLSSPSNPLQPACVTPKTQRIEYLQIAQSVKGLVNVCWGHLFERNNNRAKISQTPLKLGGLRNRPSTI